jgi:hypothetical protein
LSNEGGGKKKGSRGFFIPSIAPTWRSPLLFFLFLILVINSILAPLLFGSASIGRELGRPEVKGLVRRITDLAGRQVVIPEQVKTIVALNGSLRYVVYLQAVDLVIGVEGIEKNKNLLNGSKLPVAGFLAVLTRQPFMISWKNFP